MFFLKKNMKKHIMFCFVDHFEPMRDTNDINVERGRVDRWFNEYPKIASQYTDADGCHPKHTFFFPEEEYRKEHLDKLADICRRGFGEVEIHLHHHDDNEDNLRQTLNSFKKTLVEEHGLLSKDPDGNVGFAFIHGNWALDNSDPRGANCGINNEISILRDENCFVDMTMPSAPHPTQTKKVNSIYMAVDDKAKPKSHNTGKNVKFNGGLDGDLLIIQGPLSLQLKKGRFGLMPKIENGDILLNNPC